MRFIKLFLDDRERSVNPIHFLMLMMITASIGWVTFLVLKNHALPDLSGIAYIMGGGGAANLAQKAEDIVSKFKKFDKSDTSDTSPAPDIPKV